MHEFNKTSCGQWTDVEDTSNKLFCSYRHAGVPAALLAAALLPKIGAENGTF
jgi:hypothetical protein